MPEGASEAAAVRQIVVDESGEGQRLDNFLFRRLKGVPRSHVWRIIRSGEVRVDRGRAAADTRLAPGQVVRVPPIRLSASVAEGAAPAAPPRDFDVLYEDAWLIALNKPAGVAVHGGSGISFGVIEQLRAARPQARFLELVHRLDRDTSGLLLVACRRSALTGLQAQFRARETGKTYLALVLGDWPAAVRRIDRPLHKYLIDSGDGEGERRVRVTTADDPDGQHAITLVKVARRFEGFTLLEVTIKTGRTHQIRVHLASQGHPIAGDDKYGDFETNKALARSSLRRMALHAWRLRFSHPHDNRDMQLEAPLAAELQRHIETLHERPAL